ncbi:hypothetical protein BC938DRAFT_471778 [Jimgerdemannia flammicorona]|uniref:Uncharacterized protein n=1 Tax=Jimgerdemannia flammicorona TaxID=994334 RepID=A0A433Q7E5_9FUNG|nr:hypothetical protein BC938DRAFT_471778 [Jimgerdemannia flammicorona]
MVTDITCAHMSLGPIALYNCLLTFPFEKLQPNMALMSLIDKIPHEPTDFSLDLGLSDQDLFAPTTRTNEHGQPLFLGDYTREQLERAFEHYGIEKALDGRGYTGRIITFDTSDFFVHRITVTDSTLVAPEAHLRPKDQFLIDGFFRKKEFSVHDFKTYQFLRRVEKNDINDPEIRTTIYVKPEFAKKIYTVMEQELREHYTITVIEWLCMQDPRRTFTADRPQLPGQGHPGLKIGKKVVSLLLDLAKKHGRDAMGNVPEHFHNAYLYQIKGYRFINPAFQGFFDSIIADLQSELDTHGLAAVGWAFKNGHVRDGSDRMVIWHPEDQLYPISSRFRSYFTSRPYRRLYDRYRRVNYGARIDWADGPEIWRHSFRQDLLRKHFPYVLESEGNVVPGHIDEEDPSMSKRMALEAEMIGAQKAWRAVVGGDEEVGEKVEKDVEEAETETETEAETEAMPNTLP